MTRVEIQIGDTCLLDAQGHADYAAQGRDIVCASVSALTQTAALYADRKGEIAELSQGCGGLRVVCGGDAQTQAVFEAVYMGLREIARQYPDHVVVTLLSVQ